jgi:hypothetical protein
MVLQVARQAFTWIRDGVLVNRMHVNAVAFAMTYWLFTKKVYRVGIGLEQLINFGFAKSGLSCAEKMALFSADCGYPPDAQFTGAIDQASAFYNELATMMARSCTYFDGAILLIRQLQELGALNFITSAVEQEVLDTWAQSPDGLELSPYLTEILGKRPGFTKGHDHFAHVAKLAEGGDIFCIADAPAEIAMARQLSDQFHIVPIGFAYAVQKDDVIKAAALAEALICDPDATWRVPPPRKISAGQLAVNADRIYLPEAQELVNDLQVAGADFVVVGPAHSIMGALSSLLTRRQEP